MLVHVRCLGRNALPESFVRRFPIGEPVRPARAFDYPPVDEVLRTMDEVHERTCAAVRAMDDALLAEPAYSADGKTPHPHYRDKRGAVAHCALHETFHAGQLATIRRLLGKPFLR